MQDSMASQFSKVNENLKQYEDTIASLRNELAEVHQKVKVQSSVETKCILPTDLSQLVRSAHKALDEENQWVLGEARFDCQQNITVTRSVIQILKDQDENLLNTYPLGLVRKACRRYFESLRRQGREKVSNEEFERVKKQKRLVARRHRLYKARSKHVPAEQKAAWEKITPEMMSDVDTEGDITTHRTIVWRVGELDNFIQALDEKRNVSNIRYGPPSERGPSVRVPSEFIIE